MKYPPSKAAAPSLRNDALRIWHAGLDAVRSEKLVGDFIRVDGRWLCLGDDEPLDLNGVRNIAVVGAGKAGAGMAAAVEEIIGSQLASEKQLQGWVNVPADCVRPLQHIQLHAARPAGMNELTEDGVRGTGEILRIVEGLTPDDLCLALISGGGSALLPAPVEGISLTDKLAVTRFLSAAGANITELNAVRKKLSRIKGGGLARACGAGRLVSLIISDVLGDPLEVIASGPTVEDDSTADEALAVLEKYGAKSHGISADVLEVLSRQAADGSTSKKPTAKCHVTNHIIGNNATAVDAAGQEAERLGYVQALTCANQPEGLVEPIGVHLAEMALHMRAASGGPNCLISGGEGTVRLAPEGERGKGGRNQQTVLAALERLQRDDAQNIAILSAGTDGEDGPTNAAGAMLDEHLIAAAQQHNMSAADYLRRNDSYHFFEQLGGLIQTGPTHTNVCDLRVVLVSRKN